MCTGWFLIPRPQNMFPFKLKIGLQAYIMVIAILYLVNKYIVAFISLGIQHGLEIISRWPDFPNLNKT